MDTNKPKPPTPPNDVPPPQTAADFFTRFDEIYLDTARKIRKLTQEKRAPLCEARDEWCPCVDADNFAPEHC